MQLSAMVNDLTKDILKDTSKVVDSPLSLGFMSPIVKGSVDGSSPYSFGSGQMSVSSFSSNRGSDSGSDIWSWLSPVLNAGMQFADGLFGGGYSYNDDGTITANPSWWDSLVGNDNEMNNYAHTYNNAWNLANRQQYLAENAVTNQARQLSQLGINPASVGSNLASVSGSGGSAPSPSQYSLRSNLNTNKLALLTALLDYKIKSRELDIADKNADVNRRNALTNEFSAETDRLRSNADIGYINSQSDWQRLVNDDLGLSNSQLHSLGLSRSTIQSFGNMDFFVASALGIVSLVGNLLSGDDSAGDDLTSVVYGFDSLTDTQKSGFYQFFNDYPEASRKNKTVPLQQIQDWNYQNTSPYKIYRWLEDFYGV